MATQSPGGNVRLLVRVEQASLADDVGPVRVTIGGLSSPQAVADALAAAGGRTWVAGARLTALTTSSRLVDATGRALGRAEAEELEIALESALSAWSSPSPDLETPAGPLPCSQRTVVMGVLNVTPDSFFDGGAWFDESNHPGAAVDHGLALIEAGADIVDVGGESTRPGAEPVVEDEELARTIPVVEALVAEGATVSVDTRKPAVARAAVKAGAVLVNHVSGAPSDADMLEAVADLEAGYVVMHMRGTPETMQDDPRYDDVVAEVFDELAVKVRDGVAAGIDPRRIAVDPGIGFGKDTTHNLVLLQRLRDLTSLGQPVVVGISRKSFIGRLSGGEGPEGRLAGSLAAAAIAVNNGAGVIRAHDVPETLQAVRVARAIVDAD
jgi:dihydropteroate synthase